MGLQLLETKRFRKALQAMEGAGKNERDAASRAEKIIADLQCDPLHIEAENKRTRHGELRLQQCRKYDLACGFRLIAVKRDGRLIFTFIGTHDECQRWLENNRDFQDDGHFQPVPRRAIRARDQQESLEGERSGTDEYEEQLMARLDEQVLREIFSGLCKSNQGDM